MAKTNGHGNGSRWFRVLDEPRDWEEFYRRRWSYDKSVRTSHGVNCSGSCSWEVFVKDGLITWELQKTDWPQINSDTPNYEPRGCQRGISTSWYPYSPVRPKYPYVRAVLLDFYEAERQAGKNPVEAWAAIVEDPDRKKAYQQARGKAGWRRVTWDLSTEIIAAAKIYTIKEYGPDHLASFSPIPAMSMVSFLGWPSALKFARCYHAQLLRVVSRSTPHHADDVGRPDRRARIGRLVPKRLLDRHGLEPADDPDTGRSFRFRT